MALRILAWQTTAAFWASLLVAGGLYGLVSLSPKILIYYELRKVHHDRQWELVSLEDQVKALGETVSAFERDPRLASELTRAEFGVADPQEQRIPVDEELSFQLGTPQSSRSSLAQLPDPAWLPIVALIAGSTPIQNLALLVAATLVLFGFTVCRERRPEMTGDSRLMG